MKYITVKLTEDQAWALYTVLDEAIMQNQQDSYEKYNSFLWRVQDKLKKELAEAKNV